MAEYLTKSAARNIFYGGTIFFLILFTILTLHSHYYIRNVSTDESTLTERVSDLLDELHQVATNNDCYLEARIRDVATGQVWD